jgi:hypothetical protein
MTLLSLTIVSSPVLSSNLKPYVPLLTAVPFTLMFVGKLTVAFLVLGKTVTLASEVTSSTMAMRLKKTFMSRLLVIEVNHSWEAFLYNDSQRVKFPKLKWHEDVGGNGLDLPTI